MRRTDAAFRDGFRAAMLESARCDLELYSTPEAKRKPLVAWAALPHGFNRDAFRAAVTATSQPPLSAAQAAEAHAFNLAILQKKVAYLALLAHEETEHVAH